MLFQTSFLKVASHSASSKIMSRRCVLFPTVEAPERRELPENASSDRRWPPGPILTFEFEQALSSTNACSASGHDALMWAPPRNLEEYRKQQLLGEIHAVCVNGEIQARWKHSIVTPIQKSNSQVYYRTCMLPVSLSYCLRAGRPWP